MNIPHNEQKHNNNQLSLQYIGNLSYHNGKSATNYDSVNSLTTPNNRYTLLYPDLVSELFDFALHNSNNVKNNALFLRNLSINNAKYFSLDSSMSASLHSSLSPRDILYFLQIVSLYQLELSKGNSSITYPSLKLAKLLGVDASCNDVNVLDDANMRATILRMTAKLESLGLLRVFRSKRKNGMDLSNKLIPILPDRLYENIKASPSNLKVGDSSKLEHESNLEHILRTKLFVPIELEFMKSLFRNNLPSKYKLFFLNCIMSAYRSFRQNSSGSNMLSFSATSSELVEKNNISRSTLDRIFRYVKQQGDSFFLQVEHKYTKSDDIDCNRYDKSIFVISINPLVFPISQIKPQKEEITEFDHDIFQDTNSSLLPDTYKGFGVGWSKKQPSIIKKTALNNKEKIIKNKYNRNIDYIDVKSEKEFLENELCSFPSASYNNSSFLNNPCKKDELKKKEEWKELRNFYPLSDKDINLLNSRANREFSNNFVNQLLLKLYIKYPEKRFKNRFTFLSYMVQILTNEKHQGPLVNHTSFRFSCNIGTEEKSLLKYERYLNQIEDSLDTSKEMCIKKKIAGRFSTEVAYKILTKTQFKTNHDNSFITALVPNHLALSERQIETLSDQLEAVYSVNGYYVQEVEKEILLPKTPAFNNDANGEPIETLDSSNTSAAISEEVLENTAWHQIRKGLRKELGEVVDEAWFSKAEATECRATGTLTLTMPTRFMSDWTRNNYSHVIRRLSEGCGVKGVEYRYE
ncbi:hypothetical protein N7281_07900 [Rickettsia hoogstraalii]|uniref:DnaA N-terminal domain-containing protein n=1 Tax=Rickettsia hoogstraalii TaxID=467174 RepID=UPI00224D57D7|nr:DnaA N-terminal domain-containing protein [Rickettsia hoogstraalii]MCX4084720.1 hypothetical protein [Rickettsia hoogstraalii]